MPLTCGLSQLFLQLLAKSFALSIVDHCLEAFIFFIYIKKIITRFLTGCATFVLKGTIYIDKLY